MSLYKLVDKSNALFDIIGIRFTTGRSCLFFKHKNSNISEIIVAKNNSVSNILNNQVVLTFDYMKDDVSSIFNVFFKEVSKFSVNVYYVKFLINVDNKEEEEFFNKIFLNSNINYSFVRSNEYQILLDDEKIKKDREVIKTNNSVDNSQLNNNDISEVDNSKNIENKEISFMKNEELSNSGTGSNLNILDSKINIGQQYLNKSSSNNNLNTIYKSTGNSSSSSLIYKNNEIDNDNFFEDEFLKKEKKKVPKISKVACFLFIISILFFILSLIMFILT